MAASATKPSADQASPKTAAPIDRIDPRSRIVTAAAFSVLVTLLTALPALGAALGAAVVAALAARQRPLTVLRRMLPLNVFVLFLVVLLPLGVEGTPVFRMGSLAYSREGLVLAAAITLKANAVVLALIVLLGTLDTATLAHALAHLHVPEKLIHLLAFTVRYLDVLGRERRQLATAMKVRGFRPGMNRHTLRTYGYLVGMLLVRSVDRAERIAAAMKCRGFRGRFYLLDHFAFSWRDVAFAVLVVAMLAGLILAEWV